MPCSCRSHAAARLRSRPASLTSRWARLSAPPCRGCGAGTGRPRGPLRPAPPPRLSVAGRRDAYGNGGSLRLWDGGSAQGEEGRGPRSGPVSRGVRRRRGSALPRGAGRGRRGEAADAGQGSGEGEGARAAGPNLRGPRPAPAHRSLTGPRPSLRRLPCAAARPGDPRSAPAPPSAAVRHGGAWRRVGPRRRGLAAGRRPARSPDDRGRPVAAVEHPGVGAPCLCSARCACAPQWSDCHPARQER